MLYIRNKQTLTYSPFIHTITHASAISTHRWLQIAWRLNVPTAHKVYELNYRHKYHMKLKAVPLHDTKVLGRRGGIAPINDYLGTRWVWVVSVTPRPRFRPGERTPGTHCTGGWVGPRTGLDTEARGKILSHLPGIEPRSTGRRARNHTLYWLSYPAHSKVWGGTGTYLEQRLEMYFSSKYEKLKMNEWHFLNLLLANYKAQLQCRTRDSLVYLSIFVYRTLCYEAFSVTETIQPIIIGWQVND
jgi:hypothetical protein